MAIFLLLILLAASATPAVAVAKRARGNRRKVGNVGISQQDLIPTWKGDAQLRRSQLLASDPLGMTIEVMANGLEAYSPVLEDGRVYLVECIGTYAYGFWGMSVADATFYTDHHGRWRRFDRGLIVAGMGPKSLKDWQGDTILHKYTFLLEGNGKRIPVSIGLPPDGSSRSEPGAHLTLRFIVSHENDPE